MVADGAYGTLLAAHARPGAHVDELCLSAPARVVDAHRSYIDAGARRVQTNSFLAWTLPTMRRRDTYLASLDCAREAARSASDVAVAATIGPAGPEPRAFYGDLELLFGHDCGIVICETVTDATTAGAFLRAWREVAPGVPARAVLSLSIDPAAGVDAWRWIGRLGFGDGVEPGLNCCTGPAGLRDPLELLAEHGLPLHVAPSAGLPAGDAATGRLRHPLDPQAFAEGVAALVDGLDMASVGGCCGTTPAHIEALAAALAA